MGSLFWWHWVIIGVVLILLELIVPSFTIFWFGLGAVVTGLLLAALPQMSLALQLLVFSLSSIAFTFIWFRVFAQRKKVKPLMGDEQQAIGQTGIAATRALIPGELGRISFSVPVLGRESWMYLSDEPVETGNRVRVVAVLVSTEHEDILKVEKVR